MKPDEPRRLSFYRRLSAEQKREYDRSDARRTLPLTPAAALGVAADEVVHALEDGALAQVRRAAQRLVDDVCASLGGRSRRAPAAVPRVKVLRARPRRGQSEFHGLYTRFENGECEIRVWMLTAANAQVVKPRTFLRTLLHEVCHHVDMTILDLPHSLHTLGFHARESSLLRALEESGATIPGGRHPRRPGGPGVTEPPGMVQQLDLFNRSSAGSSSGRRRERDG
ncbi:MAG: hypothetical protein ABW298_02845 [Candidatus Binatia bacterium]